MEMIENIQLERCNQNMDVLARIFGIAGIAATVIIYQQRGRQKLLLFKLISDVLWLLHYFFLGAYSGAAISVIAIIRELVFINRDKSKWAKNPVWLYLFLGISAVSAIMTWKGALSLLPMLASMAAVVGFWIGKPKFSRILSFPIASCMLTYDFFSGSVEGCINELLTLCSSAYGYYRFDRKGAESVNNSQK